MNEVKELEINKFKEIEDMNELEEIQGGYRGGQWSAVVDKIIGIFIKD